MSGGTGDRLSGENGLANCGSRSSVVVPHSVTELKGIRRFRMLQRALETKRQAAGEGPVTVVNLAYNNEGSYSFKFTLRDYSYLNYDLVSLHSGYNDLILDPDANLSV